MPARESSLIDHSSAASITEGWYISQRYLGESLADGGHNFLLDHFRYQLNVFTTPCRTDVGVCPTNSHVKSPTGEWFTEILKNLLTSATTSLSPGEKNTAAEARSGCNTRISWLLISTRACDPLPGLSAWFFRRRSYVGGWLSGSLQMARQIYSRLHLGRYRTKWSVSGTRLILFCWHSCSHL